MSEIILTSIFSSAVLTALINGLFSLINKRTEKNSADREYMKAIGECVTHLMLSDIERDARKYNDRGELSIEDYKKFTQKVSAYKNIGGNGWCDSLVEMVDELPKKG